MTIVSTSYIYTKEYSDPVAWLKRISFYTGIIEALAQKNEVISIERINYEGEFIQNGAKYVFFRSSKKIISFPFHMHRYIRKQKPDVVLVNGLIFPFQLIQLRHAIGRNSKIIVLHRSEKPFTGIKKYFQKLADRYVNAYLFSSMQFKQEWSGNITEKKMHEVMLVSSGFFFMDRTVARQKTNAAGEPMFLWVGRLDNNKDPMTAVAAFLRFWAVKPSARLYMIYQDDSLLIELKKFVASHQDAAEAVIFIGKASHEELQAWYNSADYYLSASCYEGGGTAVCEAISCGCIPVLTNIPSFRKITSDGKFGMLYEPGNINELFQVLLRTKDLDMENEQIRVLKQFREELSFEAIAGKINTIINAIR